MSVSSYTNVAKVLALYPAIGSASAVTSGTIFEYITAATDEIDSRLALLYALPVAAGVPLLQSLATRLAAADLLTWRALAHVGADQQAKSPFFSAAKACRDVLDKLSMGAMVMLNSSGSIVPVLANQFATSTTKGYVPTFNEDSLIDAVIDPTKLDAIAGQRGLTP